MTLRDRKLVGIWLLTGVLMIYIQVVIGGITRLTGSGLSITKWEVVTGTVPPLNETRWMEEFELYKASPQYLQVNKGMSLDEFKFIYFWEYFHRLWARLLGFVFLIPFAYFLLRKKITRPLVKRALIAFFLGGLVGVFGWLMVASGLNERPLVSPYKLAIHLSLALVTFGYLLWVIFELLSRPEENQLKLKKLRNFSFVLTGLVSIQIILGAFISGMRSALFYPTWPDMNGKFIPEVLLQMESWSWWAFLHFDKDPLANAFFQFLHRNLGYLLVVLFAVFIYKAWKQMNSRPSRFSLLVLPGIVILQVLLGIFTLLQSIGTIPVGLGVTHQAVAIVLLAVMLFINFRLSGSRLS